MTGDSSSAVEGYEGILRRPRRVHCSNPAGVYSTMWIDLMVAVVGGGGAFGAHAALQYEKKDATAYPQQWPISRSLDLSILLRCGLSKDAIG